MADIFLSYVHEDLGQAKVLVQALEGQGWSVWWDRTIIPGQSFKRVIADALEDAECVVVLWSGRSVDSDWVNDEAEEAQRRNILVSVHVDDVRPPMGFRQQQAANLVDWSGDASHAGFGLLVRGIAALVPLRPSPQSVPEVLTDVAPRPAVPKEAAVQQGRSEPTIKNSPTQSISKVPMTSEGTSAEVKRTGRPKGKKTVSPKKSTSGPAAGKGGGIVGYFEICGPSSDPTRRAIMRHAKAA